jgi:beta propeller repeat protein
MRQIRVLLLSSVTLLAACADDPVRPATTPHLPGPVVSSALIGAPYVFTVTTRQVTSNLAAQVDPSIWGDIVVYSDFRLGSSDIFFTNLATFVEAPVTTAAGAQQLHDVSGPIVVFTTMDVVPVQVLSYDLETGVSAPVAPAAYTQRDPTIDGTRVAFEVYPAGVSSNADVALADLSTGAYTVLTSTPEHEGRPVVVGDVIAFERGAARLDPSGQIVVYDIGTGTETVVGTGLDPHTDGHRVAWSTGAAGTQDIIVRDLTTGAVNTIALSGPQSRPRLSGDFLTFDDQSTGNPDVVIYHLPSGHMHRLGGSSSTEFLNDVNGNRVAYTSNQTGNFDIFLVEFAIALGEIDVAPANVNFGDVPVGQSATQIVTISNLGAADLSIHSVSLASGSAAEFSVQSVTPAAPVAIGPGDVVDVEVRFTPLAQGPFAGTLHLTSSDIDEPIIGVPLAGAGTTGQTLAQQIEDLLAFFDAAVTGETLVGDGQGSSAAKRLSALRNMLVAAGGMIAEGKIADACAQLGDVRDRTDGEPQPPDFAGGADAMTLHVRISALLVSLGCT